MTLKIERFLSLLPLTTINRHSYNILVKSTNGLLQTQRTSMIIFIRPCTDDCGAAEDKKGLNKKHIGQLLQVDTPIIPIKKIKKFIVDCMKAVCVPEKNASALAKILVAADYRGHYSHGMNRLEMYVDECADGSCDGSAKPKILKNTPCTAWVDGRNGLGVVVGNFCMDLAMKQAEDCGVGWVCAKNSNHYGIAGWYSLMAIRRCLIGLSVCNTSPLVSPARSKGAAALGTNPLTLGAPALDGDSFVLDMATSAVAVGKIEIQRRKKEPIPQGWAQDLTGKITTDPEIAIKSSCLMPLGGAEIYSGYKGTGLGMLVEVLSGILAGANYGPHIRKWGVPTEGKKANLGQCFIAVDPNCFAPNFDERMSDLNDFIRNMKKADPKKPVLIPGDPERMHMRAVDECGGIRYLPNQMKTCQKLAEKFKIDPIDC